MRCHWRYVGLVCGMREVDGECGTSGKRGGGGGVEPSMK